MTEETRIKLGYFLPILGGVIVGALSIYDVSYILSLLNQSILAEISISSPMKIFISLHLFFGLSSMTVAFLGSYLLLKGYSRASAVVVALGALLALVTLIIPPTFGFSPQTSSLVASIIGILLIISGAIIGIRTRPAFPRKEPLLTTLEVANLAVFSALYAIMIVFTWTIYPIPSPTGGYLHLGDMVVFVAALLFGYKVGGLTGIVGAVLADFYLAYPRWYVSILAHGLEGFIPGLTRKKPIGLQIVACIVGGFLMASTYFFVNIFIKGYPVAVISFIQDLVGQAGISIVVGVIVVTVVKRSLPQFR